MKHLLLVIAFVMAMLGQQVHATESAGSTVTKAFTTTTTEFPNPERGWFRGGSNTPPYFYMQDFEAGVLSATYATGARLVVGVVGLGAYTGTDTIPPAFLNNLTAKFALVRAAGLKMVLWIAYNYDQSNLDAPTTRAVGHINQLGPIFKANADVIAFAKFGVIGNYGEEWYGNGGAGGACPNLAAACFQQISNALLASYDINTTIGVRYPRYVNRMFPSGIDNSIRFNGSAQSRLGYHDDCFMSDNTDVGTYSSSTLGLGNPERARVAADTNYAPFGGETCSGFSPQRLACSDILGEGAAYHLAYLNRLFYQAFFDSWTSGGCYAQVERSIGYRFQLDGIVHQGTANVGQSITATVTMRNQGWSRIFSARHLNLSLRNTSTGTTLVCTGNQDMRSLAPAAVASTTLKIPCNLGSLAAGTYDVYLSLPDIWPSTSSNANYAVRFANLDNSGQAQAWDAANARFKVGTQLVISP
jgi:hypothetical protein